MSTVRLPRTGPSTLVQMGQIKRRFFGRRWAFLVAWQTDLRQADASDPPRSIP